MPRHSWFTSAVFAAALFALLSFSGANAAEKGETARTLQNIDRYSKGLAIGMSFADSVRILGSPTEKKDVPGAGSDAVYYATWLQKGYSLDAQFTREGRIISYGVHWYGDKGAAPEFKSVLSGGFKEESRLKTRSARLEGEDVVVSWTKTQVPGSEKFIDVLTVAKK